MMPPVEETADVDLESSGSSVDSPFLARTIWLVVAWSRAAMVVQAAQRDQLGRTRGCETASSDEVGGKRL